MASSSSASSTPAVDPAFEGAGKKPGLELWRIEKMKPVRIAPIDGKLHTGWVGGCRRPRDDVCTALVVVVWFGLILYCGSG